MKIYVCKYVYLHTGRLGWQSRPFGTCADIHANPPLQQFVPVMRLIKNFGNCAQTHNPPRLRAYFRFDETLYFALTRVATVGHILHMLLRAYFCVYVDYVDVCICVNGGI